MPSILIVEHDERMRGELMKLETPFQRFVVDSADKAWAFVEAGFTFDEVVYFADPIAEALLRAAAIGEDVELTASDLAIIDEATIARAA